MAELLASKNVAEEEEPQLRSIPDVSTAVIGAVGVAERGPVGEATLLTSWDDYVRIFGGYLADGELPMAVRGIYRQDPGAYVYVVRTVHYDPNPTDSANKTSEQAEVMIQGTQAAASAGAVTSGVAGPWNLNPGEFLDVHVDEDVGGPERVQFDAVQATVEGGAGSYPLTIAHGFDIAFDGGDAQTVVYAAGHADIEAALADINSQIVDGRAIDDGSGNIDFQSDTYGTDSSVALSSEVGTGLSDIGHSTGTTTEATSDVANINSVTFAELSARVAADVTVATVTVTEETGGEATITSDTDGSGSSVQIESSSTATGFGFDNLLHSGDATSQVDTLKILGKYDGTYAEALRPVIGAATNGEADYFNFYTQNADGVNLETFPNVQNTDDTADDFIETVLNADSASGGSRYFEADDQAVVGGLRPNNGTYTPTGGDDGLSGIVDADFLGDSAGDTGLHALNTVQDLRIALIPGRATSAIHNGMITYCEGDRNGTCFAVLDPPEGQTAAQMVTYVDTTAAIYEASEYAAIYWPWIEVLNPDKTAYGSEDNIIVPPAAWVAGVYSRTDRATIGGIYKPPAGIERGRIFGLLGFETEEVLDERKRDLIYPKNINPISKEPGTPRFIDGTRVLKRSGNFPSVAERRGVIHIEEQIKNGTIFGRHSNNDGSLRARIFRTVFQYLKTQMNLGAFRTKDTETAFFVDVSDALNPPSVQFQNKIIGRIGLATQKPADWIIFYFSQDTRALLEELGE